MMTIDDLPSDGRTLTFECKTCDEAFAIIQALKPSGYWAHIICLASGIITLHLRPLTSDEEL